ncbi:uncharacterized protein EV420DRAFT_1544638 [Desarmillaria tabescens]|uniref:Uncharacterized protein n=1 Tax=Armillaria tabescens TaxID=1929756 RepID=A0AA39KBX6_ARMTA|nr:uncharacterized protein EV420DRAFT_1544638 [Desarmillaria tabescens]KAK0458275.1 hypothetical protein EV420DRAFT_1544638 [Desarmillaria tabescens]
MTYRLRSRKNRFSQTERAAHQELLLAGRANMTGLPVLPNELLEILSYWPSIPIPAKNRRVFSEKYMPRFGALLALSQTCRSLRNVFLPLLILPWEKEVATELVRQLEVVTIRDPYPRGICGVGSPKAFYESFDKCVFTTVKTLVFPPNGYTILSCCPEVRKVACTTRTESMGGIIKTMIKSCQQIESLDTMTRKMKGIRDFRAINLCSSHMTMIPKYHVHKHPKALHDIVEHVKKILQDIPARENEMKTLVVDFRDKRRMYRAKGIHPLV